MTVSQRHVEQVIRRHEAEAARRIHEDRAPLVGELITRERPRDLPPDPEPVLDVDYLTVEYRSLKALFRDLTACGARNCLEGRAPALTGKGRFKAMCERLEQRFSNGTLPLRLELVFGHAWGAGVLTPGEYRIDVGAIGQRRRG